MRMHVNPEERDAFGLALAVLNRAGLPYVLAGAYAAHHYTGVWRNTKDMDVFLLPDDAPRALQRLRTVGFDTGVVDRHWLAKAFLGEYMVDLIYGQGNWMNPVDRLWFDRSEPGVLFGHPVSFAPVEEVIWSKAYVVHRERYDGADIMHLIRYAHDKIDWDHLVARFTDHWELLYSYLVLYRFVYPADRNDIPRRVMRELTRRLGKGIEEPPPSERICRGPLIDRFSFLYDVEQQGYVDPRDQLARARGYPAEDVVHERRWARQQLKKEVRPEERLGPRQAEHVHVPGDEGTGEDTEAEQMSL